MARPRPSFGALLSFLLLGDFLSAVGLAGMFVTFAGVVALAAGDDVMTLRTVLRAAGSRAVLGGVGVGALYAIGSTSYRGAILNLGLEDLTVASLFTLGCVSVTQAVAMTGWLAVRDPAALRVSLTRWRTAVWIGVTGVGASVFWYSAFSQQATAYVLAVGQSEVIVAFLWSHFHFKERVRLGEIAGILVVLAGITLVVISV